MAARKSYSGQGKLAPDEFFREVARRLESDIKESVPRLAETLLGKRPPGTAQVSDTEVLALVQRNWASQEFRTKLWQAVGDTRFIDLAERAGLYQSPSRTRPVARSAYTDDPQEEVPSGQY
jgi:hypothetical protein